MQIILATKPQLNIVQELVHKIWPAAYVETGIISLDQMNYMLDRFYSQESLYAQQEQGQVFLLAEEDGIFYGFAAYELNCGTPGKTKLHKIYVLPNTQGKGIGKQLLDEVIEKALAAQNHTLFLNVNKYNKAKSFYEHIGFEVIADEVIDIGQGYVMDDYVMAKKIDTNPLL